MLPQVRGVSRDQIVISLLQSREIVDSALLAETCFRSIELAPNSTAKNE